jgi:hypothetical protein
MDDGLMDELLERDPLVLLRGEVALADDERKGRLARALMQNRVAEELDRWDTRVRRNLRALAHEGLGAIVRERLSDRGMSPHVRELACELAGICGVSDSNEALITVAMDSGDGIRLRTAAVRALTTLADPSSIVQLIPLARDPLPEDDDDELKGSALRAICPTVCSATDALAFLTPQRNRSMIGSYSRFLSRDLPNALTVSELPAALEWIRRVPESHDPMDEFGSLAESILIRGAESMEQANVLAALAGTVAMYLEHHRDLLSFRTRDQSEVFSAEAGRHQLVEALVPHIRDGKLDSVTMVMSTPRLVTADDLPWLLQQLSDAVGGENEATWAELVSWAARFEETDLDAVMQARATSSHLLELTRWRFGPVDLNSALAIQMRQQHAKQRQWDEERRRLIGEPPDFDAIIDSLLDRFEAGDLEAFWQLDIALWGEQGQRDAISGGGDFTTSPGWTRANTKRRARIAAAAMAYLEGYQPSDDWLDPGHGYYPASAGYRALRYIVEHTPENIEVLAGRAICGWVPALITFRLDEDDPAADLYLLNLIRDRCFDGLAESACRRLLAEAERSDGYLFILHRLQPLLSGRLGTVLLELSRTENLRAVSQAQLLKELLRADVDGAKETCLAELSNESIDADPERTRAIAAALLDSGGPDEWHHVWPLLSAHRDWGQAVIEALASDRNHARDFRTELTDSDLADLFIWLSAVFPADEDPSRFGSGFVGPREQVTDYREQILRLLVARGSADSLEALTRIETEANRDLTFARIRAEENWLRNSWSPPRPEDVIRIAADAQTRIATSAGDLQRVILESLERIQEMLRFGGQSNQVWDTAVQRPKQETEVAAWIADRLHSELEGRGIIINREVEVRVNPRGGIGDRTDIQIDAIAGERVEGAHQVTVVIEVKGCWHRELLTALRTQLAAQYLSATQRHGIYLVIWFGTDRWAENGDATRHRACSRRDPDDVLQALRAQAAELRAEGIQIVPVILDASLS